MFITLIVVMVTWVNKYVQTHQVVCVNYVQFLLFFFANSIKEKTTVVLFKKQSWTVTKYWKEMNIALGRLIFEGLSQIKQLKFIE